MFLSLPNLYRGLGRAWKSAATGYSDLSPSYFSHKFKYDIILDEIASTVLLYYDIFYIIYLVGWLLQLRKMGYFTLSLFVYLLYSVNNIVT